jgi:hypothetical protein
MTQPRLRVLAVGVRRHGRWRVRLPLWSYLRRLVGAN